MSTQKVLSIKIDVNGSAAAASMAIASASVGRFGSMVSSMAGIVGSSGSRVLSIMTSWKTAAVSLVTLLSGAVVVRGIDSVASSLDNASEYMRQFNQDAATVSTLKFLAPRVNVPFETLADSALKADIALQRLVDNGIRNVYGVDLLGPNGSGKSSLDFVAELGDSLTRLGYDQRQKLGVLDEIFGKQALALDKLMSGGSLANYRQELDRLGGPTSERAVQAGVRIADSMDNLRFSVGRLKEEAVVAFEGIITPLVDGLATRVGGLPQKVTNVGEAFRTAFGKGPDAEAAKSDLLQLGREIVGAAKVSVIELAKIGAQTFVSTVEIGIATFGPAISDLAYQVLAPLLRRLPGVGLDALPYSPAEQLQQARERKANAEAMALRQGFNLSETGTNAFGRTMPVYQDGGINLLDPTRRRASGDMLFNTALGMAVDEEREAVKSYRATLLEIDQLEKQVREQRERRINTFFSTLDQESERVAGAVESGVKRMNDAWDEVGGRMNDMSRFLPPEQMGPPASLAGGTYDDSRQRFFAMLGPMLLAVSASGGVAGDRQDSRYANSVRERPALLREFQAREADAYNRTGEASRIRQQLAFEKERQELFEQYGAAAERMLPRLNAVQAAEERRSRVEAAMTAITRQLTDEQRRYSDAVQLRANQVQNGTLRQLEAQRADDEGMRKLKEVTDSTVSELRRLQEAYPEFAKYVADTTNEVAKNVQMLEVSLARVSRGDWRAGLRAGVQDFTDAAGEGFTQFRDFASSSLQTASSEMARFAIAGIQDFRNWEEAGRNALGNIANAVAQVAAQMLAMRLISGAIGLFGPALGGGSSLLGAGSLAGRGASGAGAFSLQNPVTSNISLGSLTSRAGLFSLGGEVRGYDGGGTVTNGSLSNVDSVVAGLVRGEGVLNRSAVRRNPGMVDYMNTGGNVQPARIQAGRGGGGGGITINQTINVTSQGGKVNTSQFEEVFEASVLRVLRRPRVRQVIEEISGVD